MAARQAVLPRSACTGPQLVTLVVAHTVPNGIRLAADMRISDDGAARPPTFDSAALKAIIVHPHACVAFAGRPFKAAFDAIRDLDLPRGKTPDIAAVCDHLLGVHRRDHLDLDFLVAAVNPTRLIQIKGGVAMGNPDICRVDRVTSCVRGLPRCVQRSWSTRPDPLELPCSRISRSVPGCASRGGSGDVSKMGKCPVRRGGNRPRCCAAFDDCDAGRR